MLGADLHTQRGLMSCYIADAISNGHCTFPRDLEPQEALDSTTLILLDDTSTGSAIDTE